MDNLAPAHILVLASDEVKPGDWFSTKRWPLVVLVEGGCGPDLMTLEETGFAIPARRCTRACRDYAAGPHENRLGLSRCVNVLGIALLYDVCQGQRCSLSCFPCHGGQ